MYQDGEAEELVGAWMEARSCRDEIVLAARVGSMVWAETADSLRLVNTLTVTTPRQPTPVGS